MITDRRQPGFRPEAWRDFPQLARERARRRLFGLAFILLLSAAAIGALDLLNAS